MTTPISALIIENEPQNVRDLKRALARISTEVHLLAVAASGEEGLRQVLEFQPDLIFLDIDLGDMAGFEMLEKLDNRLDRLPAVIFVTGHEEYGVKAFRYHAVDYLMKPVIPEELQEAIGKVMAQKPLSIRQRLDQMDRHVRRLQVQEQLFGIVSRKGTKFVKMANITRIKAEQNRSDFFLVKDQKEQYVNHSIKELHQAFEPYGFLRVSQSNLINIRYLHSVEQHSIKLHGHDELIPISKRYRKEVMNQLRGLV